MLTPMSMVSMLTLTMMLGTQSLLQSSVRTSQNNHLSQAIDEPENYAKVTRSIFLKVELPYDLVFFRRSVGGRVSDPV